MCGLSLCRYFALAVGFCVSLDAQSTEDPSPPETTVPEAAPAYVLPGLNFSPYLDGQDPNRSSQIPLSQVQARMKIVAPYTAWIRSFGMQNGLENIPAVARYYKKKVAAQAWLGPDTVQNAREIGNLITAARSGTVDIAIVGSEVLLRRDLSEAQLLSYMSQVRAAVPASVLVATAGTYGELLSHPQLIAASDVVLGNFFPYWEEVPVEKAVCSLRLRYQRLVAAAGGKGVIIAETGWPSNGAPKGAAVASPANALRFFREFVSWARANNVTYWYFAAFDESWKASYEGPVGAYWGIWDKGGVMKAGMSTVFAGQVVPVDCTTCGAGTPALDFTYVPPMGSGEWLEGKACHIDPVQVSLVFYINVAGNWWVKPYSNSPITVIQSDGSWSSEYVTGGMDQTASQFAAFVIPKSYSPPVILGGPLPAGLYQAAVVWKQASRSNLSVRGRIVDATNSPVGGAAVALTGADLAATTTAASGKYSFVTVSSAGTDMVTPSLAGYTFTPPNRVITLGGASSTADFAATAAADLTVTGKFVPSVVAPQGTSTYTLTFTNIGLGPATSALLTITVPSGITLLSVSTTRGTCSSGNPVVCSAGTMLPTEVVSLTLNLRTGNIGRYTFISVATTPQPDTNPKNNTLKQTLAVDQKPVLVSLSPAALTSARNTPVTFTGVYSDPDGLSDLTTFYVYAGDTAAAGLRVRYVAAANSLSLINDAGTGYLPGCAPGAAQVISNSRGSLDCAGTSVVAGANITINWRIQSLTLVNAQKIWLCAVDKQSISTAKAMGVWTITP